MLPQRLLILYLATALQLDNISITPTAESPRTGELFAVISIAALLECGSYQDHANGEQSAKADDYSISSTLSSEYTRLLKLVAHLGQGGSNLASL